MSNHCPCTVLIARNAAETTDHVRGNLADALPVHNPVRGCRRGAIDPRWDHLARRRGEAFCPRSEALDRRHHLVFDLYEEGKLSLDEYLDRVVFFEDRPFSRKGFRAFMLASPWRVRG